MTLRMVSPQALLVVEEDVVRVVTLGVQGARIVTLGVQGPPGPTGSGGTPEVIAFAFAFGDAASTIYTMPVAGRIVEAAVSYRTAFNGTAPTLTLGHNLVVESILAATESDPKQAVQYGTYPDLDLVASDQIKLAISPSGSSQGAGIVRLIISFGS